MTIAQDIRGALQGVLDTIDGFPPASQRGYDGVVFSPTAGIPWARINLITNAGMPFSLNTSDVEGGFLQVSYFFPGPSKGTAAAEAMADTIANAYRAFYRGGLSKGAARLWIGFVRRGPLLPDADYIQAPVRVGWRCLTAS